MGALVPLYLAGLAALALPVVLHLVRRTPRGRQDFSSLMFLAPTPPRLTRRSRLDQLLLLLLRAAALALIALAFSRPFLREASALSFPDVPGRRVAILLDTSASMRRGDLWKQAVRQAERELDELNPQDDLALVAFSERPQTILDFERPGGEAVGDKRALARSRLPSLKPGWAATDLGAALVATATELDAASDERSRAREPVIVVISDFQKGSKIEALTAYQWPRTVRVVPRAILPAQTTNAFAYELPREEHDERTDPRVRVMNAADSKRDQFHLSWTGELTPQQKLPEVAAYVPAGQSRVIRLPRGADLKADRIVLRGDDHDFDNVFYVVPPQKQNLTILYAGKDAADDPQGLQYYLRLAVANDPLRQVAVQPLDPAALAPPADNASRGPQLAVVAGPLAEGIERSLHAFVERGATLLLVPTDRQAAFAAYFDDVELADEAPLAEGKYLLLGELDFAHPLFAPFAHPRYSDFTKIHFWQRRRFALKEGASTKVVARFDNAEPALIERLLGKGCVLALASGWQPDESQLALSSKFVPLIGGILDQAYGGTQAAPSIAVNQPATLPATEADAAAARTVKLPDGRELPLAAGERTFAGTDQPGIYRVTGGAAETQFAVNLAAAEGNTAPLELEQLEQRGVRFGELKSRKERIQRERQERDTELESRQKLWRGLLAAALAVLVFETFWAGRAERQIRRGADA